MEGSRQVTIKDEEAIVRWKGREIFIEGYDLENEELALVLNHGIGQGMGVLLIALKEYWDGNSDLNPILDNFTSALGDIDKDPNNIYEDGSYGSTFLATYLSYGPDLGRRYMAALRGSFSDTTWQRLLNDKDPQYIACIASNRTLPEKCLSFLVHHKAEEVRENLAERENLPQPIIKELSKDKVPSVRATLFKNKTIPSQLADELKKDPEVGAILQEEIAVMRANIKSNLSVGRYRKIMPKIAKLEKDPQLLYALALEGGSGIREKVAGNSNIDLETMKLLARDPEEKVRLALSQQNLPKEIKDILHGRELDAEEIQV